MTTFEYVSVILSVVVSLAFAHLLTGLVRLIHARSIRFSLVYAGWIGLLLFWCVDYWFSVWQLRSSDVWTLGFVAFLLLMATVLYIACGLAVPSESDLEGGNNLAAFHDVNRRRYLGALFAYQVLSIFGNLAIAPLQSAALVNIGQIALVGAAWLWPDRRIQMVAIVVMYLLTGWYASHYVSAL